MIAPANPGRAYPAVLGQTSSGDSRTQRAKANSLQHQNVRLVDAPLATLSHPRIPHQMQKGTWECGQRAGYPA